MGVLKAQDYTTAFRVFSSLEAKGKNASLRLDDMCILLYLSEQKQANATALSDALHLAKPRISRCLNRLEARSVIQSSILRSDYRSLHFRLTNRGSNYVFALQKEMGAGVLKSALAAYCKLQEATRNAEEDSSIKKISDSLQRVYAVLAHVKTPMSIADLCQSTYLSHNRLSQALSGAQEGGWLALIPSKEDRRVRLVSFTPHGKKLAKFFA